MLQLTYSGVIALATGAAVAMLAAHFLLENNILKPSVFCVAKYQSFAFYRDLSLMELLCTKWYTNFVEPLAIPWQHGPRVLERVLNHGVLVAVSYRMWQCNRATAI